jgi:hypothetical protein
MASLYCKSFPDVRSALLICECQAIEPLTSKEIGVAHSLTFELPSKPFSVNTQPNPRQYCHARERERAHRIRCYTYDLQSLEGKGYGAQGKGKGFGMKRVMGSPRDDITKLWEDSVAFWN